MSFRIPLMCVAMILLAITNAIAQDKKEVRRADSGVDNLAVIIELPSSSPHLRVLSQSEVESASASGVVRLRVPIASERLADLPVAEVDEDPITVGEYRRALVQPQQEEEAAAPSTDATDPMKFLERLVNIRLIVREAKEIGLDELPDVRNRLDVFARRTLREHLIASRIEGVREDEVEVEKLYREAVREWRIKALLFIEEKDATEFRDAVHSGAAFDNAAGKYVAEGKAESKGGKEGEFVKRKDISPEMAERIGELKPGSVSPVIPTKDRFTVIRIEEERFPDFPEIRAMAKKRALNFAQNTALAAYNRQLTDKYMKLDKELFDALDFGGTVDNFQRMQKDDRVVARIDGEEPLTVSQLAQGIRERYFHGMEKAITDNTVNDRKLPVLNDLVSKRIFLKEAKAQGFDKTPEYVRAVADDESTALFGAFVEKVLQPEIKITPDDLRHYYNENIDQYTFPEMVKLKSLSFGNASLAQAALEKLRKGTDFGWMKANADGQIPSETGEAARFGEGVVTVPSLPEPVREALVGAGEGSFILYRQEGKWFHVLNVEKRVLPRIQPFEDVQKDVLQQVYKEKLENTLRDWTAKLKSAYGAKVYAVGFSGVAP